MWFVYFVVPPTPAPSMMHRSLPDPSGPRESAEVHRGVRMGPRQTIAWCGNPLQVTAEGEAERRIQLEILGAALFALATTVLIRDHHATRGVVSFCEPLSQDGNAAYPAVMQQAMKHGSLASSHLNLTLRCYEQGMISTLTGRQFLIGGLGSRRFEPALCEGGRRCGSAPKHPSSMWVVEERLFCVS